MIVDECTTYRNIVTSTSPYLFPFVLEYSLIAIGALTVMFLSVNFDTDDSGNAVRGIQHMFRIKAIQLGTPNNNGKRMLIDGH